MENIVRRRIRFYGRVQGVGFRYIACRMADMAGATGWVRNEYDGSVTMELQCSPERIDRVLAGLDSARYIHIERTECTELPAEKGEKSFRVRY